MKVSPFAGKPVEPALSHACGAALDNPDLIVACVVGDDEAETGALLATTKLASSI